MRPSFSVKIERSVVISGFSLLNPVGLRTVTTFGESEVRWPLGGAASTVDADLEPWIGTKGLRFHDKSSKLVLTALASLIQETRLDQRHARDGISLVVGSDGALSAQDEVVRDAMLTPSHMNPKAYPNRGCNVIAGQASLRFGVRGESSVVSSGYGSGIDALIYAARKLAVKPNPSAAYLVAAGEALSRPRAWRKQHCSNTGISVLTEGAVACCLEVGSGRFAPGGWHIEGFQQCHTAGHSLDVLYGRFLDDFDLQNHDIHVCLKADRDCIDCKIDGVHTALPHDYFGASLLMSAFDAAGKVERAQSALRISMVNHDRAGNTSIVLLRRLEA